MDLRPQKNKPAPRTVTKAAAPIVMPIMAAFGMTYPSSGEGDAIEEDGADADVDGLVTVLDGDRNAERAFSSVPNMAWTRSISEHDEIEVVQGLLLQQPTKGGEVKLQVYQIADRLSWLQFCGRILSKCCGENEEDRRCFGGQTPNPLAQGSTGTASDEFSCVVLANIEFAVHRAAEAEVQS